MEKIVKMDEYRKNYAGERYYTLNQYLRERFGEKVYKLALDGGMSCPNRDGTLGYGGCIFCSGGGSGEFAEKLWKSGGEVYNGGELQESAAGKACHVSEVSDDEEKEKLGEGMVVTQQAERALCERKEKIYSEGMGVTQQIERAKMRICRKTDAHKFIAYFQSYTNTYAPVEYLRRIFTEAVSHPEVAVLSIATRPDCLPPAVVSLLAELNQIKPVWVELGLQTIHAETAAYIRRGYDLGCYEEAVIALRKAGIEVITHVILGLPGESVENMLETVRYLAEPIAERKAKEDCAVKNYGRYRTNGIKLQLLHVLKGTDLAAEYQNGAFEVLSMEQYMEILGACIRLLPPDMVVHRITGDGPKALLIAPEWSANKKYVLNTIRRYMKEQDIWQGQDYCSSSL